MKKCLDVDCRDSYGYFHGVSTTRTKVIVDFDEIFSVCRAFNPKLIDKKNFSKRLCFDGDKWKIL